ncbi:MAG: redoxin [Rheinheimera sp.]|uniref:TlpA family protein disulfide reductase n=1 Tax=Arsukibacterium sp. UBA3155 TaxID=1946058 RepID=UPI000C8A5A60|nr:redoxin family protein [Arsukibacterium sp. UBA3155]MAD77668.1 redoxin [Rheinheimera sp.]|tara:strand:- start:34952 stop:35875 length:924 start_codon:yes stop_codon:yes gene_type:complete
MNKLVSLLVLSCLAFLLAENASATTLNSAGLKKFPDYAAADLATAASDKPLYIKFWASWCQPCMEQMPHFQELYQQYGDDVTFIAVNIDINEKPAAIAEVIKRFGLTMPVWVDTEGQLALQLGLVGTPLSVLINDQGQQVYSSHLSDQALDGFIQRLAAGQQLPAAQSSEISKTRQQQILAPYQQGSHYLFFTATWCDWYLAQSRPAMAEQCQRVQRGFNELASMAPEANWTGIVNHLWTDEAALAEFTTKYAIAIPFQIDNHGVLFQHFNVRNMPLLLKITDGKVVTEITDFSDPARVIQQLSASN